MDEHLKYPEWRGPYLAAMLEVDSIKMKAKIGMAEDAIHFRMIGSRAEPAKRQAILVALNALKFIKR